MEQYISKSVLVAEIERKQEEEVSYYDNGSFASWADENHYLTLETIKSFINTIEVKEVEETEQRMKECPFRQDICNRYRGTQVKCDGKCSWVVDYLKLKEFKAQKGEEV